MRHNSWATLRLIDFCAGLGEEQLSATAPGTYGDIPDTLQHLVGAETWYRVLVSGRPPERRWTRDAPPPLATLRDQALSNQRFWDSLLSGAFDPERRVAKQGEPIGWPVGVLIAQTLNHGNEHRAHICTVLGASELTPPEIDGWAYGEATGRTAPV